MTRCLPLLVLLVLALLAPIAALAQSNRYSTDCEAARQALSINNPNTLAPCSTSTPSAPAVPALTTKQMVQTQVVGTLVDAFINMLISNDSQANAKKQLMMAELQARQAEAERQKQHEEAMRLAAICARLQATLKLSGLPQLQLKTDAEGPQGLRLKLGDSDDGHVGVPGLPGIALNDNTGNGASTPYGIPGLPGIYTNGRATPATAPSGNLQANTGGLALKFGDGSIISSIPAQQTQPNPLMQSGQVVDPRSMTPQQLADLASNLSPEQQQQLVNAMQADSSAGTGPSVSNALPASTTNSASGSAVHLSATTTLSAAPPPTTASLAASGAQTSSLPSMGAPSSAFGQLQQTAAASHAAAAAQTPEAAKGGAGVGFDQAAAGTAYLPSTNASGHAASLTSKSVQPGAATLTSAHSHTVTTSATSMMVNTAVPALPLGPGSAATANMAPGEPIISSSVPDLPPVPPPSRIQQLTSEQLQTETCRTRTMLTQIGRDSRKDSQEMDAMIKEINETKKEAVLAGAKCLSDLLEKYINDKMDDKEKEHPRVGFEKDANKIRDYQREISKITGEYGESNGKREANLDFELGYLNAAYEFLHNGKVMPWVASAKCALDFSYLATKVYLQQEHIQMLNNNLDSSSGVLKAESAVSGFYKKLVDESLRRGMDPKTFCK
jgi:hypothetical protein